MVIHSDAKPFCCDLCSRRFKHEKRLKKHAPKCGISYVPKLEQCGICGEYFNMLKLHLPVHAERLVHECEICGKSYKNQGFLETHMLKHAQDDYYKCDVCTEKNCP